MTRRPSTSISTTSATSPVAFFEIRGCWRGLFFGAVAEYLLQRRTGPHSPHIILLNPQEDSNLGECCFFLI